MKKPNAIQNLSYTEIEKSNQFSNLTMGMILPLNEMNKAQNGLILKAKDKGKTKINILIDDKLNQELDEIALKAGYSKDTLIEKCLAYAKNNIKWT